MKSLATFLFFILLVHTCVAQTDFFEPMLPWDQTAAEPAPTQDNNIKSVRVECYESLPAHRPTFQSGKTYQYDRSGKLSKVIETEKDQEDTTYVHGYHYNSNGVLGWKTTKDRRFDRTYRSGYRFTKAQTVYQVKSYEMLNNNERLLLKSRQYIYGDQDDNILMAIRTLENNQVIKVQRFDYDQSMRVVAETFEDGRGELIKMVNYEYDQADRITRVVMTEPGRGTAQYLYVYNTQGQPVRVEWYEGQELKGRVLYEYNQAGQIANLNQTLFPDTPQQRSVFRVYQYETYTPSLSSQGETDKTIVKN